MKPTRKRKHRVEIPLDLIPTPVYDITQRIRITSLPLPLLGVVLFGSATVAFVLTWAVAR